MAIVDYFLKLDGIQGEAQDKTHKLEIEIESFSWGAVQAGTAAIGGGMGAGRVQMQDFHFVMRVNKSSPKLMLACATGDHIKSAIPDLPQGGQGSAGIPEGHLHGLPGRFLPNGRFRRRQRPADGPDLAELH